MVVVLPHPDGPSRAMNSPSLISRFRSLTATTLPKRFVRCSSLTLTKIYPLRLTFHHSVYKLFGIKSFERFFYELNAHPLYATILMVIKYFWVSRKNIIAGRRYRRENAASIP